MNKSAGAQSLQTIDQLLQRIDNQKKADAPLSEPGGYNGASSHPSTKIDDRLAKAQEGARSSENSSDVKEDQGASSVDSTAPGTPGGQDSVQMNIGTNQSATGEDPSVETESAKGGKDDPGSSHPARTDNDSLEGGKYASAQNVLKLIKVAQAQGTSLVAKIAVEADGVTQQKAAHLQSQGMVGEAGPKGQPGPAGDAGVNKAAQAGAQLADVVLTNPQLKQAQDQVVVQSIAETIKAAFDMADQTHVYMSSFEAATKRAQEEGMDDSAKKSPPDDSGEPAPASGEDPGAGGSDPAAGGGDPMAGGGGEGGGDPMGGGGSPLAGVDPRQLEQLLMMLLQGGQQMGAPGAAQGMMAPGGMGGDPAMGGGDPMMGGGDPMMGGGDPMMGGAPPPGAGAPPPPPGADPMAGGGDPALLKAALDQAGVSPDMFKAAVAKKAAAMLPRRNSRWQPKTAAEAQQFQNVLAYVQEVMRS